MTPDTATEAFATTLATKGLDVRQLAPARGISEMLMFFRDIRSDGCVPVNGDMLLFQWGTYDWGSGSHFEVDITRQFIAADREDDDAISQLHLTYRFTPTFLLRSHGSGNRWCQTRDDIAMFEDYLGCHPALEAVSGVDPIEVALTYEYV